MNTKSLQSVLKEFREKFVISIYKQKEWKSHFSCDEVESFLLHSIADLLEGEGSRIIEEVEANWGITSSGNAPMLGDGKGVSNTIVFMDYKKWQEIKAHLAEVVLKIRGMK